MEDKPKLIIPILIVTLLLVVFLLPISFNFIKKDTTDLNIPRSELNGLSLNDIFDIDNTTIFDNLDNRNFNDIFNLTNNTIFSNLSNRSFNNLFNIDNNTIFIKLNNKSLNNVFSSNLIVNGDFSNGITGWTTNIPSTNYDVTGNEIIVTGNDIATRYYIFQDYTANIGNKMYLAYDKATYITNNVKAKTTFLTYNVSMTGITPYTHFSSIIDWYHMRYFGLDILDDTILSTNYIKGTNFMLFDLTALFGASNEPTLEQFEMLQQFYIDNIMTETLFYYLYEPTLTTDYALLHQFYIDNIITEPLITYLFDLTLSTNFAMLQQFYIDNINNTDLVNYLFNLSLTDEQYTYYHELYLYYLSL